MPAVTDDPFIHQEMIEILYHTLWETVHVFFEHRELGHDAGDAGFLYPFLGQQKQDDRRLDCRSRRVHPDEGRTTTPGCASAGGRRSSPTQIASYRAGHRRPRARAAAS